MEYTFIFIRVKRHATWNYGSLNEQQFVACHELCLKPVALQVQHTKHFGYSCGARSAQKAIILPLGIHEAGTTEHTDFCRRSAQATMLTWHGNK